jgi:hypothetical protein
MGFVFSCYKQILYDKNCIIFDLGFMYKVREKASYPYANKNKLISVLVLTDLF